MTFPVYQGNPWLTSKDVSRSKRVNLCFNNNIISHFSLFTQCLWGLVIFILPRSALFIKKGVVVRTT